MLFLSRLFPTLALMVSLLVLGLCPASSAMADDKPLNVDLPDYLSLHGQATWVRQRKAGFNAAYSGPKSLDSGKEWAYSTTLTLFAGLRLPNDWEIYWNPEASEGRTMSNLQGLGGFTNGESQRTAGNSLTWYRARLFTRKTWHLNQEYEQVASEANQVKTQYATERIVFTMGNLSVLDIFDAMDYSRDPRTQYSNWSSLTYGAFDYAADARGYTWGAALEYIRPDWSLRIGRFAMPKESNGLPLNLQLHRQYGDVIEFEKPYHLAGQPGTWRILGFHNRVFAGAFDNALTAQPINPDISQVRQRQSKRGLGVGVQQQIIPDWGVYFRLAQSDGKTETYAFTEIDRSLALGSVWQGRFWRRHADAFGLAVYQNGLSSSHRQYLAAGGQGFFLGDGKLNYRPEQISEAYYRWQAHPTFSLTLNWQHIQNPGYNADRGPVNVWSFRTHVEF
ncbi:carbohydrate porin [Parvibium lacunae]|uniref:Carbohydrate porin n=1 Tax=Parvibium lacunae TaxID=1888893 RepID=A0A368L7D0_9BURK|nr:carbohydrate porin [Parvibium lacunae]RCS59553.1 carbohydrate porin [Parvibium lacunae]